MKHVRIVCDCCGHQSAEMPTTVRLPVASVDDPSANQTSRSWPPSECPSCGSHWVRFQAGDEYLIGLTHVAPTPRPTAAGRG